LNNNIETMKISVYQKDFNYSRRELKNSLVFYYFFISSSIFDCFLKTFREKIIHIAYCEWIIFYRYKIQRAEKSIYARTKVSIQEEMESFPSRERMRAHAWVCAKGWKRKKVPLSPTLAAVSDKRTSRCTSANPRPQLFCF